MVFLLLFLVLLLRKLPGAGMCGRDRDDVGRFDMPKEERVVVQFLLLEVVWFLYSTWCEFLFLAAACGC